MKTNFPNSEASQQAVEGCLMTACASLDLDIAELWAETDGVKRCISVYASPTTIQNHAAKLVGIYHGRDAIHKLSPELVTRVAASHEPLWSTAESDGEPLHPSIPLATAIVTSYESPELNTLVSMVCFSLKQHQRSEVKLKFLQELTKAAGIASLEFPEHVEEFASGTVSPAMSWPREQEERKDMHDTHGQDETKSTFVVTENFSLSWTSFPPLVSVPSQMTWADFQRIEHLTDGSTAEVFTAFMGDKSVVIKLLKTECMASSVALQDFEQERECLLRLNHPNIMKIYGYGSDPRPFLVLERLDGGSVGQMLGGANIRDRRRRFQRRKQLTYSHLLQSAIDMASALEYMHDRAVEGGTVIHRDLKPDNMGFCVTGSVKLMDFGLCKLVKKRTHDSQLYKMTGNTGSLRYMAPEVVRAAPYNEKVDVYSFAIILWQMSKLQVPFQGMTRDRFMVEVVVGGERPRIPPDWPQEFAALLRACWDEDPSVRPSFAVIRQRLEHLRSQVQKEVDDPGIKKFVNFILHRGHGDRHSSWF